MQGGNGNAGGAIDAGSGSRRVVDGRRGGWAKQQTRRDTGRSPTAWQC